MEKDKTRALRRFNTSLYVKKQIRIKADYGYTDFGCVGKYKKQAALNCGDPKCVMCGNPRKFFKTITFPEINSKVKLQEGIREYNEGS